MLPSYRLQFKKVADLPLSDNADLWESEIYEQLAKEHPYLMRYAQGGVDWSNGEFDEKSGKADGVIMLHVGDTPLRIPVTVRDFKMMPLDLFIRPDGSVDYLTEQVVLEFARPVAGSPGRDVQYNMPQTGMRYAPVQTMRSLLAKMSEDPYARDELVRRMGSLADDDEAMADSLERVKEAVDAGVDTKRYDVVYARQQGSTAFKLAFLRDGHVLKDKFCSRHEATADPSSLMSKMASRAARDGEAFFVGRPGSYTPDVFCNGEPHPLFAEPTEKVAAAPGATGTIEDAEGNVHTGRLYAKTTISKHSTNRGDIPVFDEDSPAIFVTSDGDYVDDSNNRYDLDTSGGADAAAPDGVPLSQVEQGVRGLLRIADNYVVGPVTVRNVRRDHLGERFVTLDAPTGTVTLVPSSRIVGSPTFLDEQGTSGKRYMVPESMEILALRDPIVTLSPHNEKQANLQRARNVLADEGLTGEIHLKRAGNQVMVHDEEERRDVVPGMAQALLMSRGIAPQSASRCVDLAMREKIGEARRFTLYGFPGLPSQATAPPLTRQEKEAAQQAVEQVLEHEHALGLLAGELYRLRKEGLSLEEGRMLTEEDLLRMGGPAEAGAMEGPASAPPAPGSEMPSGAGVEVENVEEGDDIESMQDEINVLRSVTPQNAMRFGEAIETLTEARKHLAMLLLSVRRQQIEKINEQIVKQGLRSVHYILRALRALESEETPTLMTS